MKKLWLLLLLISPAAFAQKSIYYLNSSWTSILGQPTDYMRELIKVSDKSYRYIDFKKDAVVCRGEVHNLDSEKEVNDFLIYCMSDRGKYLPQTFDTLKFEKATAKLLVFKNDKKASECLFKNNKAHYIQLWDKQGKECLSNGTGQLCDDNEQHDDRKDYVLFKDSVLVENFTVRLSKNDTLYNVADQLAMPKNGISQFYEELLSVMKYPTIARYKNTQGTVYINFVVDTDGQLVDFSALDLGDKKYKLLETKSIKNLKKLKAWNPSYRNNRPVKSHFTLPIKYELTD